MSPLLKWLPKVLLKEDDDVIDFVNENFKKENINILTNHKAVEVKGKNLICEFE